MGAVELKSLYAAMQTNFWSIAFFGCVQTNCHFCRQHLSKVMLDCIWMNPHFSALYFFIFCIFKEQDMREKYCEHMKKPATTVKCWKIFAPIFLQIFFHGYVINMCAIDLTVNQGRLEENWGNYDFITVENCSEARAKPKSVAHRPTLFGELFGQVHLSELLLSSPSRDLSYCQWHLTTLHQLLLPGRPCHQRFSLGSFSSGGIWRGTWMKGLSMKLWRSNVDMWLWNPGINCIG